MQPTCNISKIQKFKDWLDSNCKFLNYTIDEYVYNKDNNNKYYFPMFEEYGRLISMIDEDTLFYNFIFMDIKGKYQVYYCARYFDSVYDIFYYTKTNKNKLKTTYYVYDKNQKKFVKRIMSLCNLNTPEQYKRELFNICNNSYITSDILNFNINDMTIKCTHIKKINEDFIQLYDNKRNIKLEFDKNKRTLYIEDNEVISTIYEELQ